ncbi:hypothetical protein CC2G_007257 [Coprinopsis cinerea AmutBmut pab1-1]|nr:hypothetical protein CC2G_007257 [Coprinopsis cinerea AmutBmut pab1-1]
MNQCIIFQSTHFSFRLHLYILWHFAHPSRRQDSKNLSSNPLFSTNTDAPLTPPRRIAPSSSAFPALRHMTTLPTHPNPTVLLQQHRHLLTPITLIFLSPRTVSSSPHSLDSCFLFTHLSAFCFFWRLHDLIHIHFFPSSVLLPPISLSLWIKGSDR